MLDELDVAAGGDELVGREQRAARRVPRLEPLDARVVEPRELGDEPGQRAKALRELHREARSGLAILRDQLHHRAIETADRAERGVAPDHGAKLLVAVTEHAFDLALLVESREPFRQTVVELLLGLGAMKRIEAGRKHEAFRKPPRERLGDVREPRRRDLVLGTYERLLALLDPRRNDPVQARVDVQE